MPDPSRRSRAIYADEGDGWELLDRARAMIRAGRQVINLTLGEHEDPTPPRIVEALVAAARAGDTRYAPVQGTPALRAAVAARTAARTGAPCGPDQVAVTAGGQAALLYALLAVADAGETCVILDPHYATYPGTLRAAGLAVRTAPARPEAGFQPDLAALDAACRGARALLINTPNNPTGAVYDRAHLEGVAEICRRHDLWLISDEVYDGMAWTRPHLSPRGLPGMAERTLVIGSLSKSHAMTGWRLGWAAGPVAAVEVIRDVALNAAYGLPGFIQAAGLFALTEAGAEEAALTAAFRRRRDLAAEALAGARGLRLSPPDGGMYVMLDVRGAASGGGAFAEALLEAEGIAVMPGESFGAGAAGHVRVALTVPEAALVQALGRIRDFAARRAAA